MNSLKSCFVSLCSGDNESSCLLRTNEVMKKTFFFRNVYFSRERSPDPFSVNDNEISSNKPL